MALAKVIKCPNGATVRIYDDALAPTKEENDRRLRDAWDFAEKIYREALAREAAQNGDIPPQR